MATYRAIAATSETIRTLLDDACPRGEFPDVRFELFQATDFQKQLDEGISIFLYRIAINLSRRNLPPTVTPDGRKLRPPLPVDLFYLISAWGRSVSRQHGLIGWCMRTLEDVSILPAAVLNGTGPDDDTFRSHEAVELSCEPLSLPDLNNLWEILRPNVPISMTYVARMIAIESTVPMPETYAPAQTRELEFAKWPVR